MRSNRLDALTGTDFKAFFKKKQKQAIAIEIDLTMRSAEIFLAKPHKQVSKSLFVDCLLFD